MIAHLTRAALLATVALLSACLEVPGPPLEEPELPADPPKAWQDGPDAAAFAEPVSCDEQFGSARGYLFCSETEDTCSFFSQESEGELFSCDELCAELGVSCVDAFDPETNDCAVDDEDGCASRRRKHICVCLRT